MKILLGNVEARPGETGFTRQSALLKRTGWPKRKKTKKGFNSLFQVIANG